MILYFLLGGLTTAILCVIKNKLRTIKFVRETKNDTVEVTFGPTAAASLESLGVDPKIVIKRVSQATVEIVRDEMYKNNK